MKHFVKIIISLIVSFAILNILTFFYYNVPSRVQDSENVTEYKWPSHSFYSRFTEGIAWGKVNNDGYNNLTDYNPEIIINNLLMGSSQAEGFNVPQKDNMVSKLNEMTDTYTYNVGISEHTLPICISNLENAIKKYNPSDNVIIETMSISFYNDQIEKALNDEVYLETYSNRIIGFLQNFKYLKLVYSQIDSIKHSASNNATLNPINDSVLLDKMMAYANSICDKYNVNLIIVYHPTLMIDSNNQVLANYNSADMEVFKEACNKNNIIFINMEEDFISNYLDTNTLPYGFINTKPGEGHLNELGHELIAKRLKKEMGE